MSTSVSSFINNLSEIYSRRCRDKNCESKCYFIGLKNNKLHYKCNECEKIQLKPINGLINKFWKTYEICNENINNFFLSLGKGVYPYEYMDSWERFNTTPLLLKNLLTVNCI